MRLLRKCLCSLGSFLQNSLHFEASDYFISKPQTIVLAGVLYNWFKSVDDGYEIRLLHATGSSLTWSSVQQSCKKRKLLNSFFFVSRTFKR